ncbi:hypothetical protein RUND412_006207 [Rhizina undulata]
MAVAPKFAAHVLNAHAPPVHTLELLRKLIVRSLVCQDLDYVCPFSAKLFKCLVNDIKPLIVSKYPNKVQILFRHQIQPWHPSSTLVHEAALAVERVDPSKFWKFSAVCTCTSISILPCKPKKRLKYSNTQLLFEKQASYFDENVYEETRNQTYERLSALAGSVGVDAGKVYDLLKITDKLEDSGPNTGNKITSDLKLHIKAARLNSIHVSPTVVFNGIVENAISSGWDVGQWTQWLERNII